MNTLNDRLQYHIKNTPYFDIMNQFMMEFAIRKDAGEENIFDTHYAPLMRKGGLKFLDAVVGGNSPCLTNVQDNIVLGAMSLIDMLLEEEKVSKELRILRTYSDILKCIEDDKLGVFMKFEGARALTGKADEHDLSTLRSFYRLGLRGCCMLSSGRTAFGDGPGEKGAAKDGQGGKLTTFGVKAIEEMNKLGIVIDTAHMLDRVFYDVAEVSTKPITNSHTCISGVVDHGRNISDERVKAIGKCNGVMGITTLKGFVKGKVSHFNDERVTVDDFVKHINYVADLLGTVDNIAIGTDNDEFPLVSNVHRAWSPAPGYIEGLEIGVPKGRLIMEDLQHFDDYYKFIDVLIRNNYSDEDIKKVLGGNMIRVYKEVFGE